MSRECQRCGLLSPDEAVRCDCGYDFRSQTVERSYLSSDARETARATRLLQDSSRTSIRIGALLLAVAVLITVVGSLEHGEPTFYAPPFLWILFYLYAALRNSRARETLIRQQEPPADPVRTVPGQYVVPMSLAVVTAAAESNSVDLVVWVPPLRNVDINQGLSPEHIIGRLTRSMKNGGALVPDNFVPHEAFVQFLHQFLQRELPGRGGFRAAARRQREGWVTCIDLRVVEWPGWRAGSEPSPEDVLGAFEVHEGLIVPASYQRNPAHRLLSEKGLFQLEYALTHRLKDEIAARHSFRRAGSLASAHVM